MGTPQEGEDGFVAEILEGTHVPPEVPDLDVLIAEALGPQRPKGAVERIEEGVTVAFFLVMFATIVIGVFWRYVLDSPLIWTVNVATVAFIWVIMVGSGLANRDDEHIQFDLLYMRMPIGARRWARVLGNLLIIVPFAIAIPHTIDYLRFVRGNKVTGVNLTFDWAYGCVLIFLVATILHRGRLLLSDLRSDWQERAQ